MEIKNYGHLVGVVGTIFAGLILLLFSTEMNTINFAFIVSGVVIFGVLFLLLLKFVSEKKVDDSPLTNAVNESEKIADLAINTDGVFEGRDDEIIVILQMLEKQPIVVIKGSPGLGKSTLAQYLLRDNKTRRKFKVLCSANLENSKSVENNEKGSKEYIAYQILRSLPGSYNDEVSYLIQVETKLKEMKDTLLVLDNTEQIDDNDLSDTIVFWAQNLQSNIRFVLTSRRDHKVIENPFELKPLLIRKNEKEKQTEACRVLIKKLELKRKGWTYVETKENNLALFEITKKTEGVPWCIDAVAGIFKSRNYSLLELARSIESIVIPEDDLSKTTESFFERSYVEMNREVQEVFIQTCVFEGDFQFIDFDGVVNSEFSKDNLLDHLTDHSFLRGPSSGYYSLFVHVKEFGRKKLIGLEKSKFESLKQRFYNHYLKFIKISSKENIRKELGNYIRAQELLITDFKVKKAAELTLFLDEAIEASGSAGVREKILKISYHPFSNESNQTKVKLGLRLSEIYFASGDWLKAESYAKKSIYYSEKSSLLRAKSLLKLGKIYKERGFLQESVRLFNDCFSILDKTVNKEKNIFDEYVSDRLNVLDQLGKLSEFSNMVERLTYDTKSDQMARIYNRIGLKEWHHSSINESILAFDQAINIAKNLRNETWEAAYNTNKALAQIDINEFNDALYAFNDNIGTHRISGRKAWQAVTYGGKGRALLRRDNKKLGDYVTAEKNLISAIQISEEIGYPENLTWLKGDLARLYLNEDFHKSYNLEKSYDLIKETLLLHKKMGSIRNVRYFSNCITLLMIFQKQNRGRNDMDFIEVLYTLLDLYKNYVLIEVKTPTKSLQIDIEYLNKIILKLNKIKISSLKQISVIQILTKLYDKHSFGKKIDIIENNIANQKEGSYEYYASESKNQWKYFNSPETIDIFVYGILLNKDYLKFYDPIKAPLPVKSFGFKKKCNHILPESVEYSEKGILAKGNAIFNLDYSGFCSDESYGLLITLNKKGLHKLETHEKGFALRPLTYQLLKNHGNDIVIGKAYTLTSTNRFYMKQALTDDFSIKNKEYIKLCEEGAKSYGAEFFNLWKDY